MKKALITGITGQDGSYLAEFISRIVGFAGKLVFDQAMPDGTPRKLMDVSRINELGWQHSVYLEEGIKATYDWYIRHNEVPLGRGELVVESKAVA